MSTVEHEQQAVLYSETMSWLLWHLYKLGEGLSIFAQDKVLKVINTVDYVAKTHLTTRYV